MKRRTVPIAALLALALAAQPPLVAAQTAPPDDATVEMNDRATEKLWDYALCGASIAFAIGSGGWVLAVIACGHAITQHLDD
ncbi:MAG: hypothetical protein HYR74_00960 [Candidatus Eisenbacteria bacterium]|nr:hypothetical protein [Candidatus Eisenbacteria bacterium]